MKYFKHIIIPLVFISIFLLLNKNSLCERGGGRQMIKLPEPKLKGDMSLEEAISRRRSERSYQDKALSQQQISQILWAAQGITKQSGGYRSAPSAGALYPMEIYIVTNEGLFHYNPSQHSIDKLKSGDLRESLASAAWGQSFIAKAGITVIIAAVYPRITNRYGERGVRYVDMEAGHIAQNIHLQAVALGLGSVPIGAFSDDAVQELLELPKKQKTIYMVPVGYIN